MAFISLLDDRVRPKGSRDPLGFEVVWTEFGRRVVGNLTTITSHWRNFAVGLLGLHWCHLMCRDVHPDNRLEEIRAHFIRFEQLAGYLRYLAEKEGLGEYPEIMGINRVRKRIGEAPAHLPIGAGFDSQILSDQASYGIWGLYTSALRESGLLLQDQYRTPSKNGEELAKQMAGELDMAWFRDYMSGKKNRVRLADLESRAQSFHGALSRKSVRDQLIHALLRGPEGHGCCQRALYDVVRDWKKSEIAIKNNNYGEWIGRVLATRGIAPELQRSLKDIQEIERLLVTANCMFGYCRRKDGVPLKDVAKEIGRAYDFSWISEGPDLTKVHYAEELSEYRDALRRKDVTSALLTLLTLNKKVMKARDGAAWVEEKPDGRLRVRVKKELVELPEPDNLKKRWDYNYFLNSYARIAELGRSK